MTTGEGRKELPFNVQLSTLKKRERHPFSRVGEKGGFRNGRYKGRKCSLFVEGDHRHERDREQVFGKKVM